MKISDIETKYFVTYDSNKLTGGILNPNLSGLFGGSF